MLSGSAQLDTRRGLGPRISLRVGRALAGGVLDLVPGDERPSEVDGAEDDGGEDHERKGELDEDRATIAPPPPLELSVLLAVLRWRPPRGPDDLLRRGSAAPPRAVLHRSPRLPAPSMAQDFGRVWRVSQVLSNDPARMSEWRAGATALLGGEDVDELAALAQAELHLAVGHGEQGVVAAAADVLAGVEPGAPLADDDRAGGDGVPSNTFTPRRWALESRPFRVEPPPLVLDISAPQPFEIPVISMAS